MLSFGKIVHKKLINIAVYNNELNANRIKCLPHIQRLSYTCKSFALFSKQAGESIKIRSKGNAPS